MRRGTLVHDGAARASGISTIITGIALAMPAAAQCTTLWSGSPPPGIGGQSFATTAWDPDGGGPLPSKLVAGFSAANGGQAIAALDVTTLAWTTLAAPTPGYIFCLLPLPNGELLAGGNFSYTSAGPIDLARFNGTSWTQFATGTDGQVFALARMPNGDIAVGGDFTQVFPAWQTTGPLARWNGTAWTSMQLPEGLNPGVNAAVYAMLTLQNGDLVVGGWLDFSQGVLRWDGASWLPMGAGLNNSVNCLAQLPDGSVVAGGTFTASGTQSMSYVARFDGTAWQPLPGGPNSSVNSATLLPNGDLLVGGSFTTVGSVPAAGIARWDGTAWHAVPGLGQYVRALSATPTGHILAGGFFTPPGGPSFVAHGTSTCAAAVASTPTACVGPAGPMALTALSHPWLGATFASRATGFAATSLAVAVLGFAPANVPLVAALPTALPNCNLLASPDVLVLALPAAGIANWSIALPNAAPLIGMQLFHQFAQVELDGQGAIVSLSSSNALTLTLGDF